MSSRPRAEPTLNDNKKKRIFSHFTELLSTYQFEDKTDTHRSHIANWTNRCTHLSTSTSPTRSMWDRVVFDKSDKEFAACVWGPTVFAHFIISSLQGESFLPPVPPPSHPQHAPRFLRRSQARGKVRLYDTWLRRLILYFMLTKDGNAWDVASWYGELNVHSIFGRLCFQT